MRWVVLLLLFVPLGYCIEATISCPEVVVYDEEFICNVGVSDVDGVYDLKVYIRGDGSGINRIWGEGDWQRADWYVKGLVDSDEAYGVRLIIHKEFVGIGAGELKLRKSGKSSIAFEELFEIEVVEEEGEEALSTVNRLPSIDDSEEDKDKDNVVVEEKTKDDSRNNVKVTGNTINSFEKEAPKKVIKLNSQESNKEVQVVYESKNEKIKNYVTYGFIFFLICIIGILLYEKKWYLSGHENPCGV
jgi:hypothetical protein